MSKESKLIKKVIKTNVGEKPTFGTNPMDPWSTKAGITEDTINETALLNRYLKSRGINPEFVSKDQKVAHSKTNQFKTWMTSHINDPIKEGMSMQHTPTEKRLHALKKAMHYHKEIRVADGHKKLHAEAVDKKDTVTFDIPLLIRVLEFAREELKSDINLHRMVERLISMRGKGTLTMNQYGQIVKEEVINEDLAEILSRHAHHHAEMMKAMKSGDKAKQEHHHTELNKVKTEYATHSAKVNANKPESDIARDYKNQEKIRGIGHVRDHVEVEGTVVENRVVDAVKKAWKAVNNFDDPSPKYDGQTRRRQALKQKLATNKKKVAEAREANYGGDYQASVQAVKAKAAKKPVDMAALAARMQASYKKDKDVKKEDFFHGSAAAVGMPFDGANNTDDTSPQKCSCSTAKKVKLLLGGKKGQVKEEIYDHEKEDKSTAPLGKKAKFQKPDVDPTTKQSPPAAAILSGGKTLTGEPRDTIEIDPMMKMRKQADGTPEADKSKKSI